MRFFLTPAFVVLAVFGAALAALFRWSLLEFVPGSLQTGGLTLANFRAAPGTSGRIVAVLRKGTRVDVLEARNQWYRVRLADGREGWVAESVTAPAPE